MSITFATVVRPDVKKRASAISKVFSACLDQVVCYFVCRAAVASLRELDDRALRDIGLVRSQIEPAVHGFVTLSDRGRM
jgi:uncharacterized protein YjiS (DUF1127 family)